MNVTVLSNIFNKINVFINRTVNKIIFVRIKKAKIIKAYINKNDLIKMKVVKGYGERKNYNIIKD